MRAAFTNFLKRRLSWSQKRLLKDVYAKLAFGGDLRSLSQFYGTDKWVSRSESLTPNKYAGHYYAQHYESHFRALRFKPLNILEIGIGGYDNPEAGGASLRVWRSFFQNSMIYGLDIHSKKAHEERRIKTFQCSQDDPEGLKRVAAAIGSIDIIIDDGSHINSHVITTFETLFPLLNRNGIYVIEDTLTSYRPEFGGDAENLNLSTTMMGYFKNMVDGLNHAEFGTQFTPTYFDKNIVSIHFYHNLIFVYKGENNEPGWGGPA